MRRLTLTISPDIYNDMNNAVTITTKQFPGSDHPIRTPGGSGH